MIGQEVGRALGIRAIFAERQDGKLMLRRGFTLLPGEKVLVVEDVVTTGLDARNDRRRASGWSAGGRCRINHRSERRAAESRRSLSRARDHLAADVSARRLSDVRGRSARGEADHVRNCVISNSRSPTTARVSSGWQRQAEGDPFKVCSRTSWHASRDRQSQCMAQDAPMPVFTRSARWRACSSPAPTMSPR